jgi:hypothetical protein
MGRVEPNRHSQFWVWILVGVLALLLALFVFFRVAQGGMQSVVTCEGRAGPQPSVDLN